MNPLSYSLCLGMRPWGIEYWNNWCHFGIWTLSEKNFFGFEMKFIKLNYSQNNYDNNLILIKRV